MDNDKNCYEVLDYLSVLYGGDILDKDYRKQFCKLYKYGLNDIIKDITEFSKNCNTQMNKDIIKTLLECVLDRNNLYIIKSFNIFLRAYQNEEIKNTNKYIFDSGNVKYLYKMMPRYIKNLHDKDGKWQFIDYTTKIERALISRIGFHALLHAKGKQVKALIMGGNTNVHGLVIENYGKEKETYTIIYGNTKLIRADKINVIDMIENYKTCKIYDLLEHENVDIGLGRF